MFRKIALTAASVLVLSAPVLAETGHEQHIEDVAFAHEGPFGTFDLDGAPREPRVQGHVDATTEGHQECRATPWR